jgi:predicted N-acetyltransferase YhbS
MQLKIRKIEEKDYENAAAIKHMAFYIEQNKQDNIEKIIDSFYAIENMSHSQVYVCCHGEKVIGLITIHEFMVNFHNKSISINALGGVAVHNSYRMQGAADFMIRFFLEESLRCGINIVMLYPYKPAFYKKYGFGWGIEKYEYSFNTNVLKYKDSKNVFPFEQKSLELVKNLHNQYARMQHGMCYIGEYEWYKLEQEITHDDIILIRNDDGELEGYAVVRFEKDAEYNQYDQAMIVERFITLTPKAKEYFFSYLFTLKDQFETIKLYTHEQFFYYNLNNIGSIYNATISAAYHYNCRQGLGIMYKAINPQALINLIANKDIKTGYCFIINDKYNNSREEVYLGEINTENKIYINIEDFTSWIMGCISMTELYNYGLSNTKYKIAEQLDRELSFKRPICTSIF